MGEMKQKINTRLPLELIIGLVVVGLIGVAACARKTPLSTTNPDTVAIIFGSNISAEEIGLSPELPSPQSCKRLLDMIWRDVSDRYVKKHDLVATDEECEAFEKFQAEVEEHLTKKRKRDLSDIERQLKSGNLSETERKQLKEKYRKRLLYEKKLKEVPLKEESKRGISRRWVTAYKVYKDIYERYGGKVAITTFGFYPIEARRRLIDEYIRAGDIVFLKSEFESEFWESYEKGGRHIAKEDQIDFTPYWLKPIPEEGQ